MKLTNTRGIIRLNGIARRKDFNMKLDARMLQNLDPDGIHVIGQSFAHGDAQCVRAFVFLKVKNSMKPVEALLDMTFDDYDKLPDAKVDTE